VLAGLTLTVALGACAAQTGESGAIRFAVTDLQGMEELQREFGAFKDVFERTTGRTIAFYAVGDRAAAAAALNSDQVDLVFTGPAEYVVMNSRTNAVPVVAIRRPGYHSCIYTKADSDLRSIADLAGKKVAMSDVGSTSGHLGPSQMLADAGLDPMSDVTVLTVGDAVHEALVTGDVDAVGIGCHDYDEFMAKDDPSDYRMLAEGEPLPADVIIAREGMPQADVDLVRSAFEENWPAFLEAILVGEDNQKFVNAELAIVNDSDYDIVRDMYRSIGVNDFTAFVGD
jgi:phosphonate transport system substrate-binding protein